MTPNVDYDNLMERLIKLPACTLLTTGRTGTDFLQSLLDSHPDVLTFNGALFFHDFWNSSLCVGAGTFDIRDLVEEFIGKHIERLKSRYDAIDGKDRLGENYNQSINIDLDRFKSEIVRLINSKEVSSRNFMLAVYGAYSLCLGQDLSKKKILFHHIHHAEKLDDFLKDFPDSKIISMTRDPRANFVSGVEHWRKYQPATDQGAHLYYYINRILKDAVPLGKYGNRYIVIRIEDLGNDNLLKQLSNWLGISYDECMKKSTWGGLIWHGDRLSEKKKKEIGWSKDILDNNWEKKLSNMDKYVLNYIMFYRLKYYNYPYKRIGFLDSIIVLFLIFFPLSYEVRFFSIVYMRDCFRKKEWGKVAFNFLFYLRRILLFLRYYVKVTKKVKFEQPNLSCP